MKYPLLLLPLLATTGLCAPPAPGGVDALSQDDVRKALSALEQNFPHPSTSEPDFALYTLQGMLDRLAPQVALISGSGTSAAAATPFYSEVYNGTGYLRIGAMTGDNVDKAGAVLKAWSGRQLGAVILDLRGAGDPGNFDAASVLEADFCAKGTGMFRLDYGASVRGGDSVSTPNDPLYTGILVVLVDETTAEASETIAASLQECAKALIVGSNTAGRPFKYRDVPLEGAVLRMAVAEVVLPDGKKLGVSGLKPDISVAPGSASRAELARSVSTHGIASVIQEHDRPHLNEAALVSGSNPEVDELEAEQSGVAPAQPLIDRPLEQALDLVTSISIYKSKGAPVSHGTE